MNRVSYRHLWVGFLSLGAAIGQEHPTTPAPADTSGSLISLTDSLEPFEAQFNTDSQELRFLAVLSPS